MMKGEVTLEICLHAANHDTERPATAYQGSALQELHVQLVLYRETFTFFSVPCLLAGKYQKTLEVPILQ